MNTKKLHDIAVLKSHLIECYRVWGTESYQSLITNKDVVDLLKELVLEIQMGEKCICEECSKKNLSAN